MECVGGRNTLAALRRALEEEAKEESSLTGGVYLLTTGMPDQHMVSWSLTVHFNHLRANVLSHVEHNMWICCLVAITCLVTFTYFVEFTGAFFICLLGATLWS